MLCYLRAPGGAYLDVRGGALIPGSDQASYESLVIMDGFDPVSRGVAADPVMKSETQITLRTVDQELIAPAADPISGWRIAVSPGPDALAQLGGEVYRIYKMGGHKNEPLKSGDRVVLRFTTSGENPTPYWLSMGEGGLTLNPVEVPKESEIFEMYSPVDLADFSSEYNDITDTLSGTIHLTGPTLPGGHTIAFESPDAPDLFPPQSIVITDQHALYYLPLSDAAHALTPCEPREITVRAHYAATGETLENPVDLQGDRALFMSMRVRRARQAKSKLPIFKGKPVIEIIASVDLDPSAARLNPMALPLEVTLSTADPVFRTSSKRARAWPLIARSK